jgi:hypothetical protein
MFKTNESDYGNLTDIFKDRTLETKILYEKLESKRFEFIVLYGRRRIGKTSLALYACRSKRVLYYFAKEAAVNSDANLFDFYEICKRYFPDLQKYRPDFQILIEYLALNVDVIIFDEVQYLLKENRKNASVFAEIMDKFRTTQPVPLKIFMLGSSISLIKDEILSDPSPLFGRKTLDLKLNPVGFFELHHFFPTLSFKELVEIYGFSDGIPYYLEEITTHFWDWMQSRLRTRQFYLNELDWLLRIELREPGRYLAILEAIAQGHTTNGAILSSVFKEPTPMKSLTRYLDRLLSLDFIRKEVPITENPLRSHLGRYVISDNFLKFYFRFIFPNRDLINQGLLTAEMIRSAYPTYLGFIFENIVKQYLLRHPPIPFTHIGRWWGTSDTDISKEIDLLAYSHHNEQVLAIECKWQDKVNPVNIAKFLQEKLQWVKFKGPHTQKKVILMVVARSFTKKITKYDEKQVICVDELDLKDWAPR